MKKITRLFGASLLASLLSLPALNVAAQDYEDDLYYSPSRAKAKQKAEQQTRQAAENAAGLGSSDLYTTGSSKPLQIDVDSYNRRTVGSQVAEGNGSEAPAFSYTRRIERFHNPDVVSASNDTLLMDYYYSTPSEQDINVYVINNIDPYSYSWNTPVYAYSPWNAWSWPSFSFGWNSAWGWNASWNWGWADPFWGPSWGYNPWYGPSWCWGPAWGWHHHHHYPVHRPLPPYRPSGYDRPGASRPHRPSYSGGSYNRYTPGVPSSSRPGNFGYPGNRYPNSNGVRPSSPVNGGSNQGTYSPSNNDRRGRNSGTNTNTNRYNTPTRNNNGSSYSPSTGSSRGRNSGGSYRSPGSGSRGGGGGTHTGGGGGRGRGR